MVHRGASPVYEINSLSTRVSAGFNLHRLTKGHGAEVQAARAVRLAPRLHQQPQLRALHSSTSQLKVSAFCGIGGAFRGCFGVV